MAISILMEDLIDLTPSLTGWRVGNGSFCGLLDSSCGLFHHVSVSFNPEAWGVICLSNFVQK